MGAGGLFISRPSFSARVAFPNNEAERAWGRLTGTHLFNQLLTGALDVPDALPVDLQVGFKRLVLLEKSLSRAVKTDRGVSTGTLGTGYYHYENWTQGADQNVS